MSCGEACFISSARISRSISFSRSPGGISSPRPRRMIIRALGSLLEFSSLLRYSSGIPEFLASWYCEIWRDSRMLTRAVPNRHCFMLLIFPFYREWEGLVNFASWYWELWELFLTCPFALCRCRARPVRRSNMFEYTPAAQGSSFLAENENPNLETAPSRRRI